MKRNYEKELRESRWERDHWQQEYEQLKVEVERLTRERNEAATGKADREHEIVGLNVSLAEAERDLAKAREAIRAVLKSADSQGQIRFDESGELGGVLLAALAPDGKTEAELRHDCAASGRHDHDGCDCSAEELARRAALAKAREALERIAETDVIYPPHDPGDYFAPEGREGPCAKIARAALAALAPEGKPVFDLILNKIDEIKEQKK